MSLLVSIPVCFFQVRVLSEFHSGVTISKIGAQPCSHGSPGGNVYKARGDGKASCSLGCCWKGCTLDIGIHHNPVCVCGRGGGTGTDPVCHVLCRGPVISGSPPPGVQYLPQESPVLWTCTPSSERWAPGPHSQLVAGLGFKPRQSGSKAHSLSTKPGCLGRVPGKMALGFAPLPLPPGCLCSDGLSRGWSG